MIPTLSSHLDDAWWYDPAGNLSYNVINAASDYTNDYTNDPNGNTLTGGRTNIWDSQNRLAQTTFNGVTTGFIYGGQMMTAEFLLEAGL